MNRALLGDLETIVGKALEKEKSRRYPSAAALATDLRRFLNDEPVAARPASTSYQLKKFARRNRTLVSAAAVVLATLVVGTVVSTRQAVRATRAERERGAQLTVSREAHGVCLTQLDRYDEAEQALTTAHSIYENQFGPDHRQVAYPIAALVRLYEKWDKPDKAASWRERLPGKPGRPPAD